MHAYPNVGPFSIYEQPKQVRVRVGVWVIYYIHISVAYILRKCPNLPTLLSY